MTDRQRVVPRGHDSADPVAARYVAEADRRTEGSLLPDGDRCHAARADDRLPARFQDHDKPDKQYAEAGLDAAGIVDTVLKALRRNSVGIEEVRA